MASSLHPSDPVTVLHGVGAVAAQRMKRLGIETLEQLLWHIPFRYEDYRTVTPIAEVKIGQQVTVRGRLELIANRRSPRKRMMLTEALVRDDTGTLQVVWFNQGYLTRTLRPNDEVMLAGTVTNKYRTLQMQSPAYEKAGTTLHTGRLVPIYHTTAGVSQRQLRYFVASAQSILTKLDDPLPDALAKQEGLLALSETLQCIHFPKDEGDRDVALKRLKFDELLLFQLQRQRSRAVREESQSRPIPFDQKATRAFVASLPFTLTNAQKRAAWDALQDMERTTPMHRLLEGEVGSGKTVVAAIVALNALAAGTQVLFMAPTEILAQQHFRSLTQLLAKHDVPIFLWTHSTSMRARHGSAADVMKGERDAVLAAGTPALVIGTHALLRQTSPHVGLVIVDEQHRFGVSQRQQLHVGGGGIVPHLLSLTATPIPRTLALTLLGDLAVSVLTQLPKGRKAIRTHVAEPEERRSVYEHLDRELAEGRQAFVVAPLIEAGEGQVAVSVTALGEELTALLPHRRISVLHGKLPGRQKDALLRSFAAHELDLLVATPVVEVGIDVPNASIMVIEGAERFGLAQLHQLRGRVGRGAFASTCYLLARTVTPLVRQRLDAVRTSSDGFALAKLDLQLRGAGDLIGTEQSGFLDFRFASLGDEELIEHTASVAKRLFGEDPTLNSYPQLRAKLDALPQQHRE